MEGIAILIVILIAVGGSGGTAFGGLIAMFASLLTPIGQSAAYLYFGEWIPLSGLDIIKKCATFISDRSLNEWISSPKVYVGLHSLLADTSATLSFFALGLALFMVAALIDFIMKT